MNAITVQLLRDHAEDGPPLDTELVRRALEAALPGYAITVSDNLGGFSTDERGALLDAAREELRSGIYIEPDAPISHSDQGAYVGAEVWVPYGAVEIVGGAQAFERRMQAAGLDPETFENEDGAVVVPALHGGAALIARTTDPDLGWWTGHGRRSLAGSRGLRQA